MNATRLRFWQRVVNRAQIPFLVVSLFGAIFIILLLTTLLPFHVSVRPSGAIEIGDWAPLLLGFAVIDGRTDRRHMRCSDTTDNLRHGCLCVSGGSPAAFDATPTLGHHLAEFPLGDSGHRCAQELHRVTVEVGELVHYNRCCLRVAASRASSYREPRGAALRSSETCRDSPPDL